MAWIKPLKSFTGYLSADSLYVANDFFSAKKWLRIRQIYAKNLCNYAKKNCKYLIGLNIANFKSAFWLIKIMAKINPLQLFRGYL